LAADEITDLQAKVVLKAPLTGGNLLNNNMNGSTISSVNLQGVTYTSLNPSANATVTVNVSTAQYYVVSNPSVGGGNLTLNFNGWPLSANTYATVRTQVNFSGITGNVANLLLPQVGGGQAEDSLSYVKGSNANGLIRIDTYGSNSVTVVMDFWSTNSGTTIFVQDLTRGANATPNF
jgi:hypothetical protein